MDFLNISREIKLEKFSGTYKMVKLKVFEAYIKVKDYMEENNVAIEDMLGSLDRKFVQVKVDLNGVSKNSIHYLQKLNTWMYSFQL